jgi:hypothetical protein
MSKAALSSMEWRSIRIPVARSATARRPKAPSRSWLREAARRTIPFARACGTRTIGPKLKAAFCAVARHFHLVVDANPRNAARSAENPYSGISQSGNLRAETASTRGALRAMKSLHKRKFRS